MIDRPDAIAPPDVEARRTTRRAQYAVLWIVGLAIGWFEAAVVIDLRALFYPDGFRFPLGAMPLDLLAVEVVCEACSLVLLAGIGFLAGRRLSERMGAFILLFGVWDLVYYAALYGVLGWPESFGTWDLLFLIPLPWVAPVWAPALVAIGFVWAGTHLFWTADRRRAYRRMETALIVIGCAVIVVSFLAEWRVVTELKLPESFPVWLYAIGVALAAGTFVIAERRTDGPSVQGMFGPCA